MSVFAKIDVRRILWSGGGLLFAGTIAACSTSGATIGAGGSLTATPTPTGGGTATPTPTPGGTATPTPTPTPTVNAAEKIYVVNHTKSGSTGQTPSVTVYPANGSGNIAPIETISGASTGLQQPQFVSVDAAGNIWVTDQGNIPTTPPPVAARVRRPAAAVAASGGSILEYAAGTNGNVAPISAITGLDTPEGIFLDASGNIYVSTINFIYEYAPGTSGPSPAPTRAIGAASNAQTNNAGLAGPYGIRVKAGAIYVAQSEAVYVFGPTQNGNVAPQQNISGPAAATASNLDVALDAAGNIYTANFNTNTINVYGPTTTGDMPPSSVITSPNLNQPIGIAIDSAGNIFVANYGNNSIVVFPSGTTGAATGTVISGAMTGLQSPYGIIVK